jgi:response regulator RpfG family c-di-GMP phosphodiesterase
MKNHTWLGARLFQNPQSELDKLCYEVCLHHHEKWIGGGYFGRITEDISSANTFSPPKARPIQKTEIPLAARITAIADVYDALTSKRCYKPAWPEDKVLNFFRKERGRQFDPELVDIFLEIYNIIKAIRQRYDD